MHHVYFTCRWKPARGSALAGAQTQVSIGWPSRTCLMTIDHARIAHPPAGSPGARRGPNDFAKTGTMVGGVCSTTHLARWVTADAATRREDPRQSSNFVDESAERAEAMKQVISAMLLPGSKKNWVERRVRFPIRTNVVA